MLKRSYFSVSCDEGLHSINRINFEKGRFNLSLAKLNIGDTDIKATSETPQLHLTDCNLKEDFNCFQSSADSVKFENCTGAKIVYLNFQRHNSMIDFWKGNYCH